jgi:hypothetical protein
MAGHARTTRIQYAQWVTRYRESRMARTSRDLQTYLTRLSTVEKVNPKTVRQALNALKFYHENASASRSHQTPSTSRASIPTATFPSGSPTTKPWT